MHIAGGGGYWWYTENERAKEKFEEERIAKEKADAELLAAGEKAAAEAAVEKAKREKEAKATIENGVADAVVRGKLEYKIYTGFPFSSSDARRRQKETAERLGIPVEKTVTVNGVDMEFMLIPAGEFMMGNPSSTAHDSEKPVHRVRITKPFYIGKYEVTNEKYRALVPSHNSGDYRGNTLNEDKQPAVNISWDDINDKYLPKLNSALSGGYKARFPTEAEWEYTCRGGTDSEFYWGSRLYSSKEWCNSNEGGRGSKSGRDGYGVSSPVGSFKGNAFGLYDMSGNVWECCADWYDRNSYSKDEAEDPFVDVNARYRVSRGGSWDGLNAYCRSPNRYTCDPTDSKDDLGVRIVLDLSSPRFDNDEESLKGRKIEKDTLINREEERNSQAKYSDRKQAIGDDKFITNREQYDDLLHPGMANINNGDYQNVEKLFRDSLLISGFENGEAARQGIMFAETQNRIATRATKYNQYLDLGKENLINKNPTEAVRDFGRAIVEAPNQMDAYILRGSAYLEAGQPKKALGNFEQALSIDNYYEPAILGKAIAFFKAKDYQKTFDAFGVLAFITSTDELKALSDTAMGWLFLDTNNKEKNDSFPPDNIKARSYFEKAKEYDDVVAMNNLGYMFITGTGVDKDYDFAYNDTVFIPSKPKLIPPLPTNYLSTTVDQAELDKQYSGFIDCGRMLSESGDYVAAKKMFKLASMVEGYENSTEISEGISEVERLQQARRSSAMLTGQNKPLPETGEITEDVVQKGFI